MAAAHTSTSLSVLHYAIAVDGRLADLASAIDGILVDLGMPPIGELDVRRRAVADGLSGDVTITLASPPGHSFVWYRRQNNDCLVWSKDLELPAPEWLSWVEAERAKSLTPKMRSFSALLVEGETVTSEIVTTLAAMLGIPTNALSAPSANSDFAILRSAETAWIVVAEQDTVSATRFLLGFDRGTLPLALLAATLFSSEARQVENAAHLLTEGRPAHAATWPAMAAPQIGAAKLILDRAAVHASQALLSVGGDAATSWNTDIEQRLVAARRSLHRLALEAHVTVTDVDFVIITALDEERNAVLEKFDGYRRLDKDGLDTHTYFEATVASERADKAAYRVIITSLAGMGPAMALAKAQAVVTRWHPKQVLLVGIACGLPDETHHGDVLVSRQVADYTLGKQQSDGTREIRWTVFPAGPNLLDAAVNISPKWVDLIKLPRPGSGHPALCCDVIASGGDVIANDDIIKEYRDDWPKLVGIEMEAGGVAAGLHNTMDRPEFLMIKAVSDYGKDKHDDAVKPWRPYACDVAASFAAQIIRSGTGPAAAET